MLGTALLDFIINQIISKPHYSMTCQCQCRGLSRGICLEEKKTFSLSPKKSNKLDMFLDWQTQTGPTPDWPRSKPSLIWARLGHINWAQLVFGQGLDQVIETQILDHLMNACNLLYISQRIGRTPGLAAQLTRWPAWA